MPPNRRLAYLATLDWNDLTKRLCLYVHQRLGTRGTAEDAEDITHDAIERLFNPGYPSWDPDKEPDLLRHLGSVANGLVANFVRHQHIQADKQLDVGQRITPERPRTPEHIISVKQECSRVRALLAARLCGDAVCTQLVRLRFDEDIRDAREQAAHIGCSLADIYNARRRLLTHTRAVKAQLEAEERIANAQDEATNHPRS